MLLLLFRIGEERYGVDAIDVSEVLSDEPLRPLPGAPPGVAGLLALADDMVVVLDVAESVTGTPARRCRSTRIMVIRPGVGVPGARLGLRVEGLTDAVQVDPVQFSELPLAAAQAPCLGPVARLEGGLVQRLRIEDLLSPAVRASLERAATRVVEPA
jgi:chemotaxis-related protein WspB